jgi:hypothetical protein
MSSGSSSSAQASAPEVIASGSGHHGDAENAKSDESEPEPRGRHGRLRSSMRLNVDVIRAMDLLVNADVIGSKSSSKQTEKGQEALRRIISDKAARKDVEQCIERHAAMYTKRLSALAMIKALLGL